MNRKFIAKQLIMLAKQIASAKDEMDELEELYLEFSGTKNLKEFKFPGGAFYVYGNCDLGEPADTPQDYIDYSYVDFSLRLDKNPADMFDVSKEFLKAAADATKYCEKLKQKLDKLNAKAKQVKI